MLIVLVGPKGGGKSHIGRLLEASLGVHFLHVETLWMDYHARCRASGRTPVVTVGMAVVHPQIARALGCHEHLCVETTGASAEILDGLLALAPRAQIVLARISAPLELCLERIARRDPAAQIPADVERIREVHALSEACGVSPDRTISNVGLDAVDIVAAFRAAIDSRLTA
jgi:AAA domain